MQRLPWRRGIFATDAGDLRRPLQGDSTAVEPTERRAATEMNGAAQVPACRGLAPIHFSFPRPMRTLAQDGPGRTLGYKAARRGFRDDRTKGPQPAGYSGP